MYLKELRINGFKSFAGSTRFGLQPGMTAIVGPNGCGKSNIADAIRWVLGEQSYKSLRADAMQDVIFQGTDSRKPLNLCEVTLLFGDCEEQLGTDHHEVEIARRIVRDGGGEYYLNGKTCRLKDIQRLFLDTGAGQISYSFMLQGQIDQILSSNPADRRAIFEEAAGISKYKSRRREALNKLSHVEANLTRVTDVMEEVSRRFGSLKRQAAKALRYQRIKRRLTRLELAANSRRFAEHLDAISKSEREAAEHRLTLKFLQSSTRGREADLLRKKERRVEINEELQEAQKTVYDLRSAKDQAESQAEMALFRKEDFQQRAREIEEEITSHEEHKKNLSKQASGESSSRQEQQNLFASSDEAFQEKNRELAAAQEKLEKAETALGGAKQRQMMAENTLARQRSKCAALEVELKTSQIKHAALKDGIFKLNNHDELLRSNIRELRENLKARDKEKGRREKELDAMREETEKITRDFRAVQAERQQTDREAASLEAQIRVLEELQERLEGFSEGAKAILQGKLDDILPAETCRLMSRSLQFEPEHTQALEALLGPAAEALLPGDPARSAAAAARLREKKMGRACLRIPAPDLAGETPSPKKPPEFLKPASEWIRGKDDESSKLLKKLTQGCYYSPTLEEFLEFWKQNPDFEFLFVATAGGELADRRGLIFGGHGKAPVGSFLARRQEIKKLKREKTRLEKALAALDSETEKKQRILNRAQERIEARQQGLMELSEKVSTLKAQEAAARENLERNKESRENLALSLKELERIQTAAEKELEKAGEELEAAEAGLQECKEAAAQAEQAVQARRHEREIRRDALGEFRVDIAEKRQRLEMIDRGLKELEKQTGEISQLILRRQQETDTIAETIAALEEEELEHRENARQAARTLAATMESLEKKRAVLQKAEKEISQIEDSLSGEREDARRHAGELSRLEVNLTRQRAEMEHIASETRREYDAEIEEIDWKTELWKAGEALPERIRVDVEEETPEDLETVLDRGEPSPEDLAAAAEPDWEETAEEIRALRGRLNVMGPVNADAIEEYRELKERHEFLKKQSDDLWQSKEELLKAIDEINRISLDLFQNTFDQIRSNFKYTFENLFGGGEADLGLVDAEDVLESGIDIVARPPGTRLRNLGLLSGGQKALTAVALLFAVYMVKPSPFCVLDEIDAPLDDANIGRFCQMLQRFLEYSQFLIITHNKRTISAAGTIYGITMQEKGVSKVISMQFNKETQQAESVAAAAAAPA